MNTALCAELAKTGANYYLLIIGIFIMLVLNLLAIIIFKKRSKHKFVVGLSIIIILLMFPFNVFAQENTVCDHSINTSGNTSGNSGGSGQIINTVSAVNDGPFQVGTSSDNILLINIINNDSAGSSNFDFDTLDLDPSTPDIDDYYSFNNGIIAASIENMGSGTISFSPRMAQPGDVFTLPYTIRSVDGLTTNIANITVNVEDWVAQGDVLETCNYPDPTPVVVTDNDFHASGINVATVDLDPTTPGRQTTYTSSKGITFTVDNLGAVQYTLPSLEDRGQFYDTIFYTVENNDGGVSNIAPIAVVYGACG